MVIVLIHWQVRPGHEERFLDYWRGVAAVRDRRGLVGEFLSRVAPGQAPLPPWVTWRLADDAGPDAVHFVNVGMWDGEAAFLEQIAGDFGDDQPPASFELRRRRRVLLSPAAWRVGGAALPRSDSAGVI